MPKKKTKELNPFSVEYAKQELEFYGLKEYKSDGVEINTVNLLGRCDDYLNVNFRTGEIDAPRMLINNRLWMSITFMEIQSHWIPIRKAKGKIATAGLGMGYFVLRAIEKPEVKSIDVYEIEQKVVDYFKKNFSNRKGFEKIKFIVGDARKKMKKKTYDFVFVDIYQTLLEDELITDAKLFRKNNKIKEYYPWGYCLVVLHLLERGLTEPFDLDMNAFFRFWMQTKGYQLRRVADHTEDDYLEDVNCAVEA